MPYAAMPPEPMRSETFPYPDRFAADASSLGPVCYFDSGPPPKPRGLPPIVLIHALGTNLTTWEYVAPALAQHTRVLGLDLPGCGRSTKPRVAYRVSLMHEAVIGLLDHVREPQAVLFGHSFGGRIAMDLALAHRQRVVGLVLMNSAGLFPYPRWMHVLAPYLLHEQLVAPAIVVAVKLLLRRIFAQPTARTQRFVSQVLDRYDPRYAWEFARYACPMLPDLMGDLGPRLRELDLPVQVIWGEEDHLLSLRSVTPALATLPRARVRTLARCGHMPNFEQPEAVIETALQFLRELGASHSHAASLIASA
jgi:pimeloyl-ACP methyl ester carboxylesterase